MPILHLIGKPLSILRTACSSVFQLAASDRKTSGFRPDQQQASDQAFWPSLASKEESVTIAVKPEMAATNAHARELTSTRTLTLRNGIGSVANSVKIFQRNHILRSEHPKFELAYTWLFVFFCLAAVTTIATLQIKQRNKTANYLDQKITTILDSQYTCGCSLPQSLSALQRIPAQPVSNYGLQRCYSKDELETITVVQFNSDTAHDIATTVKNFNNSVNISYGSNQKGFSFVKKKVTELVLWTGTDNRTLSSICNGVPYLDTVFTLPLNDSNLPVYFDYPLSYMRMAIEYNCSNCSVCSPQAIMNALNKTQPSFLVPLHRWVECSGYGNDTNPQNPCNATQSYHGRCNLYPTSDISMSSRLTNVIDTLEKMNSSLHITTGTNGQKGIEMHANVLYYNQSKVVEKNDVTYGYFQRDSSTDPIWPILVASYPNIAGSCSDMETFNVSVCNGTSICNVYKELDENGVSTAAFSCTDFSQDYEKCLLLASASGNENIRDQLCERNSPSCQKVRPYEVNYLIRDLVTTPDTMSVSNIMNNSWLQTYKNGVCSTEYAEVVPYTLASGISVFLETTCNSQDLCTITGNYSAVNDTPDMQPRPVDGPDRKNLESSLTPNYVCYKLTKVPWPTFAITLFGTIGGWLTTMYTVANMFYSRAYDGWHAWRTRRTGSGRVGTAADTDDATNGGDQLNAGSDDPLSESTSSRHIMAGQSQSTKTLELLAVETVVEQTTQPSSGNPVMRQRSIARSVGEKEVTCLPQF